MTPSFIESSKASICCLVVILFPNRELTPSSDGVMVPW